MKSFKIEGMGNSGLAGVRDGAGLPRGRSAGRPCCASQPLPPLDVSPVRTSLTAQFFTAQEDPTLQDLTLKEFAAVFKNKSDNMAPVCTRGDNSIPCKTTTVFPALLRSQLKWNPLIAYAPPSDDRAEPMVNECFDDDQLDGISPYPSSVLKKTLFRDSGVYYNNQATMTSNRTRCNLCRNKMRRGEVSESWMCMPWKHRRRKIAKPPEAEFVEVCSQRSCEDLESLSTGCSSCSGKSMSGDHSFPCHLIGDFLEDEWVKKDTSEKRRTLYNEGISDEIAFNPFYKQKVRRNYRVPLPTPYCEDYAVESWIPHSHRGNSKYHRNCLGPGHRDLVGGLFGRIGSCQRAIRTPHSSPRVPRKILASEKTIGCCALNDFKYHPRCVYLYS